MKISYVLALTMASNLMLSAEEAISLRSRQKCKNQHSTNQPTPK